MIKIYNGENLDEIMSNGLWLVDFSAKWCGPCRMLEPNLEEISNKCNILKIDVDSYKNLAIKYGVMSIPTIILFNDGKTLKESIGYKTIEELEEFIKEK